MNNEQKIKDISELSKQIATDKKFEKHGNEFLDPDLGPVQNVKTREDLQKHVYEILTDKKTDCFKVEKGFEKGTVFFYNRETNTLIVAPGREGLEPTVYRPDKFEEKFQDKFERTSDIQGYAPEIKKGIRELLPELGRAQTREELTKDFRVASREATTVSERAAGKVGGVIERTGDIITDTIEGTALGIEAFFFGGASRKAPGGAEYVPPNDRSTITREQSQADKDRKLLKRAGEHDHQLPHVQEAMNRNPVHIDANMADRVRRHQEEQQHKHEELYRDNDDWDRER